MEIIFIKDLGMRYPKLTSKQKKRFGLYKCFCGNEFEANSNDIKSGNTKSCGCLGIASRYKHHLSKERIYRILLGMKRRCYNKNHSSYKDYGGRGIIICDEWLDDVVSFYNWAIKNGYKENLTIDRINNDGNYEPDNCRWVNMSIQAQNTRKIKANNTSGYRGIIKIKNSYRATIWVNKKQIYLGQYKDIIDAARVRDKYIIENNLEHPLNL